MHRLKYSVYMFLILSSFLISGCLFDSEDDDPCDATIMPEISVYFDFTVRTFYQIEGEERQPLNNTSLNVTVYKHLCDDEIKGKFDFSDSSTGSDHIFSMSTVEYNLHNSDDRVKLSAEIYFIDEPDSIGILGTDSAIDVIYYEDAEPYDGMTMTRTIDLVVDAYRY